MPSIHPSAIVDARAELADDVVIGPHCVIEGRVRIGAGTRLIARVFLQGPLVLGERNIIYPGACLGFPPQDRKFDPATEGAGVMIGKGNVLRECVTIHRATGLEPTRLGDENYLMVNAHLAHDVKVGNRCTLANNAALGGHVELHDGAILGGNAAVQQFCRIGRLAMLSGVTGITRDLPPFCICYKSRAVGSLNLVGLRRAGLRQHIQPLKEAFDILYRQRHSMPVAVRLIEQRLGDDPLCQELARFVRSSKRGIVAHTPGSGRRNAADDACDVDED